MLLFELVASFVFFSLLSHDFLCHITQMSSFFCTFDVREKAKFNGMTKFF